MKMESRWIFLGGGLWVNFKASLSPYPSVYRGELVDDDTKPRQVAVKRVPYNDETIQKNKKEIEVMLKLGRNPNTVNYLRSSISTEFPDLFIVMELCRKANLESVIQQHSLEYEMKRKILTHIALGVDHIHSNKILHGSLNPTNILQSLDKKNWKIAGFGLSRSIEKSCPSTSANSQLDKHDYKSPEHYNGQKRTLKTDIFLLGLTFYYVLTNGKHPFENDSGQRKSNITEGQHNLDFGDLPFSALAQDLVEKMLSLVPTNRPDIKQILRHPLLWEEKQKKKFAKRFQCIWKGLSLDQRKELEKTCQIAVDEEDINNVLLFYCRTAMLDNSDLASELQKNAEDAKYSEFSGTELSQEEEKCEEIVEKTESLTVEDSKRKQTDIVDIGESGFIFLPLLSNRAWVFNGELKEVVNQPATFKAIEYSEVNKKSMMLLKGLSCTNVVGVKRTIRGQWPSDVSHGSNDGLPQPSQDLLWLAMDSCLKLVEIKQSRTPEQLKNIAHHIVYALHQLHEENGIVHGNISLAKFCKSEDGKEVVLLGSKKMKKSKDELERQNDLRSTAKAICALMCNSPKIQQEILDTLNDLLEACENISAEEKNFFQDFLKEMWKPEASTIELLSHPLFWNPGKKVKLLSEFSNYFEKDPKRVDLEINCPKDWMIALKLKDDEKSRWYTQETDGVIYWKASRPKGQYQGKNKENSASNVLKLVHNVVKHVTPGMIEEYEKKCKCYGKQTLFRNNKADVGEFFLRRFPKLFFDVYCFVRKDRAQFDGHFNKYFSKMIAKPKLA